MIRVSLASISQNVRTLQQASKKKVFVDLSYDAFGLGAESLYRHLTFISEGVLWEHSVHNTIIYSKLKKRFPMISARSSVPRLAIDVASAQNTIVTLKSISELNDLANYGGKATKVRVMLEFSDGESLGLSEDELAFCMKKFNEDPAYHCVIPIGIIYNDGLLSESRYNELKFLYPDLDVCCYDSLKNTDIILASAFAYGYNRGRPCPRLYRTFSITGNVIGKILHKSKVQYITDLTVSTPVEAALNREYYTSEPINIGGVDHASFFIPKKEPAPKQLELVDPSIFSEAVQLVKQLSHEELTYIQRPIPYQ